MAALSDILGSQKAAIEKTQEILKIRGKIVPVTLKKCELAARYEDGSEIVGEHLIDEPKNHDGRLKIVGLFTKPKIASNPIAEREIEKADYIIFCPGDLYTSLLANVIVGKISDSILKSKARKIYVMNLMTKWGQTYGFAASDFISEIEKYTKSHLDAVLINHTKISESILQIYKKEKEEFVVNNLSRKTKIKIINSDLLNPQKIIKNSADSLKRSLVRHDAGKLAKELAKLFGVK